MGKKEKELLSEEEKINKSKDEKIEISDCEKKLNVYEISTKRTWVKTLMLFVAALLICFGFSQYQNNKLTGDNGKYAYEINNIKIETDCYNYFFEKFDKNEDETLVYIADLLLLSNIANEHDISVTDEEISAIESEYMQKEIALSIKVQQLAEERGQNVTEDELKEFYENNKYQFMKSGNVKFVALISDTPMITNSKINTEGYTINEETIERLLEDGFESKELVPETSVLIDTIANDNDIEYRYFYFTEVTPSEYYSYEEVKDTLKSYYENTYGLNGLISYVTLLEETSTISEY